MKNILLIGGAGYIGQVVAERLYTEGHNIRILDLLIYDDKIEYDFLKNKKNFEIIQGDFCNPSTLRSSLRDISDVVILGGLVGDPITKKYPKESNLINDLGIISVIESLKEININKIIFISTCSNYGIVKNDEIADENYFLEPLSSYAKSKVEAEKYILKTTFKSGAVPIILRFATAFGLAPRMRFDLTVNEFVSELYFNGALDVFDPDTWRPYCHVRDFAEMISLVLSSNNIDLNKQIFNVGNDSNNFTKRELVGLIQKHIPGVSIRYLKNGKDPRNYKVNFKKARKILGFEARYTVEEGISEILKALKKGLFQDYLQNKDRYGNYHLRSLSNE